ncbi:hypothetical protein [Streptomyces luteocolor]|uniref:hypothetical protein n=1 Tax=Streptomyces luteocolor TaxID=285500 RepID=UPI000853CB2A|nr:hypothetical protein [Streptomyces luteocolor]
MAAGPADTVLPEHALLAETLDTPWRLTLAATVFEERSADARYLRDPADLLGLSTEGRLYEYLLDHYIGAAVTARTRGADDISRPSRTDTHPRLDADGTWRRLAFLARYLNGNNDSGAGSRRRVAGRALSSTDLVLHELWPLGGKRRTQWTERVLAVAAPLTLVGVAGPSAFSDLGATGPWVLLLLLCLAVLYRPAWPTPRRIDLGRLRTPAGRRAFALGSMVGFAIGFLVLFGLKYAQSDLGDPWLQRDTLVVGIALGLTSGLPVGLARGLMTKHEQVGVVPRHLIRMDLTAAVVFGPVAAVWVVLAPEFARRLAYDVIFGTELGGGQLPGKFLDRVGDRVLHLQLPRRGRFRGPAVLRAPSAHTQEAAVAAGELP